MFDLIDAKTVAITVNGIEILALKKLSLVSHALAEKLDRSAASREQSMLASVLDDVIRRIELAGAR